MKNCLLSILFLFFSLYSFAQGEFTVDDFSDRYYAKVLVNEPDEDNRNSGLVEIVDKRTEKEVFRVDVVYFGFGFLEEKIKSNVKELPYGEQSLIMYDDFNFDGVNDFAIRDGYNSCYSGPSYVIYLADEDGFSYSPEFTELSQEYCGMFQVSPTSKRLETMVKSGCCWHQYSEYIVRDNKPFAVEIRTIESSSSHIFQVEKIEKWNGNGMEVTEKMYMNPFTSEEILSFSLEKNGKVVKVFHLHNQLFYAFLKGDEGEMEFYFPNGEEENPSFTYAGKVVFTELFFSNAAAKYTIYESDGEIGIKVFTKGKTYNMKGLKASQTGSLADIVNLEDLENLVYTE